MLGSLHSDWEDQEAAPGFSLAQVGVLKTNWEGLSTKKSRAQDVKAQLLAVVVARMKVLH